MLQEQGGKSGGKTGVTEEGQEFFYCPGVMALNIIPHWLEAPIIPLNINEY